MMELQSTAEISIILSLLLIGLQLDFIETLGCAHITNVNLKRCNCAQDPATSLIHLNCTDLNLDRYGSQKVMQDTATLTLLETFIFVGNTIGHLPVNSLGLMYHANLTLLDLSNNNIESVDPGAFHNMKNLRTLILDDNTWDLIDTQSHPRVFNHSNLQTLSLRHAFMPPTMEEASNPQTLHLLKILLEKGSMKTLQQLYLDENSLVDFEPALLEHVPNLMDLTLSNNVLTDLNVNFSLTPRLRTVDLRQNLIRIPSANFMQSVRSTSDDAVFYLNGNPFLCDCKLVPFHHWLNLTNQVADKHQLKCDSAVDIDMVNQRILSVEPSSLRCIPLHTTTASSYTVLGIVLGLVGIIAIIVLWLNRDRFLRRYILIKERLSGKHHEHTIYHSGTRYSVVD